MYPGIVAAIEELAQQLTLAVWGRLLG